MTLRCSEASLVFPATVPLALRPLAVDEHTVRGLVLGSPPSFEVDGHNVTVDGPAAYSEARLLPAKYQRAALVATPSHAFDGKELCGDDLDVALDLARGEPVVFAPSHLASIVVDLVALDLRASYRIPIHAAVKLAAKIVSSNTEEPAEILARVEAATSFPCPSGEKIDPVLTERKEVARRRHEDAAKIAAAEAKSQATNTKSFAEWRLHVFSHPVGDTFARTVADLAWSQVALGHSFIFQGRAYYVVPYALFPLVVPPQDFGLVRFHEPSEILACPEGLVRAAPRPRDVRPFRTLFAAMRAPTIDRSPAHVLHDDTTLDGARRVEIARRIVGPTLIELHTNRDVARRGPYGGKASSAFDFLGANEHSLALLIRGLSLDVITACELTLETGRAEAEANGLVWVDLPYDANDAIARFGKLATTSDTTVATDELFRETTETETSTLLLARPDLDPWRPTLAKLAREHDEFTTAEVEAALRADGFEPKPVPSHWRRVATFLRSIGFKKRDKAGAEKTRKFVRVDGVA